MDWGDFGKVVLVVSLIGLVLLGLCLGNDDGKDDSWKNKTYNQMTQEDIYNIGREANREFWGY